MSPSEPYETLEPRIRPLTEAENERLYGDSEGERAAALAKGPGASTMRVG